MSKIKLEDIQGAVARGWCSPKNEKKIMDVDLALAIADEVWKVTGEGAKAPSQDKGTATSE